MTRSSYLVISENHVTGNQSLEVGSEPPGVPVFETNEGQDCGEGIHLIGVELHATVAQNEWDLNSSGILLTDETRYNHDNLIVGNNVHDNPFACGITMASHPPSPKATIRKFRTVCSTTRLPGILRKQAFQRQGVASAAGPGNLSFGNKIIGNVLRNNGLPGVTIHNHAAGPGAPAINLNDNVIAGNKISGNTTRFGGAGPGTTAVDGLAPVYGTIIDGNTMDEAEAVVVNAPGVNAK